MTNVLITLDYELYFGSNSGTQYNCIIKPTNELVKILDVHNAKAVFFVDIGYIIKLDEYRKKFKELESDFIEVTKQLGELSRSGHELQLHIHPHWEDTIYNGEKWITDTTRYRLHQFDDDAIDHIVKSYKFELEKYALNEVNTYRAGGWCIQPFEKLRNSFSKYGIKIDSTVFKNGRNNSKTHFFNFKNTPNKEFWKFDDDPIHESDTGEFLELPISDLKVSPIFFWKLVVFRKLFSKHQSFGDGVAAGGSKSDKIRMLTRFSNTVVSIDGYKASLLKKAWQKYRNRNNLVIIGHPKALSTYSLDKFNKFLTTNKNSYKVVTYNEWLKSFDNEL